MSRSLRQTLVVLMLVLYGSVSLCGSGLHALTEAGGAHASSRRHDPKAGLTVQANSAQPKSGAHCVVCEFQAQGQLSSEPFRIISRPFTSPHIALVLALIATRDRHPSCSPRAPPIVPASADATA
jgi:hypothetical protein